MTANGCLPECSSGSLAQTQTVRAGESERDFRSQDVIEPGKLLEEVGRPRLMEDEVNEREREIAREIDR